MATATAVHPDERLTRTGVGRRLLTRPELGAGVGAIAVFTFFAVYTDQFATARGIGNMLDPAAPNVNNASRSARSRAVNRDLTCDQYGI